MQHDTTRRWRACGCVPIVGAMTTTASTTRPSTTGPSTQSVVDAIRARMVHNITNNPDQTFDYDVAGVPRRI